MRCCACLPFANLQALDETQMLVEGVLGNRFVEPLRIEAETWQTKLETLRSNLNSWTTLQDMWLLLRPVFTAPDDLLKRVLQQEVAQFAQVERKLLGLVDRVQKTPHALLQVHCHVTAVDTL
eukprot:2750774-Pleurochrysis_carterae.AAC.1